uniref:Uncharacterized protein n=1 Tax=Cacopsylla melanoneura TaxID=428564 RepID=A0A8D8SLQ1_9HEMI
MEQVFESSFSQTLEKFDNRFPNQCTLNAAHYIIFFPHINKVWWAKFVDFFHENIVAFFVRLDPSVPILGVAERRNQALVNVLNRLVQLRRQFCFCCEDGGASWEFNVHFMHYQVVEVLAIAQVFHIGDQIVPPELTVWSGECGIIECWLNEPNVILFLNFVEEDMISLVHLGQPPVEILLVP